MNTAIDFWRGKQGNDYISRNRFEDDVFNSRCLMWQKIMANCYPKYPQTILEVGANIGRNLWAIKHVSPKSELYAVEPNGSARAKLLVQPWLPIKNVHEAAAENLRMFGRDAIDLVFTCGVLIHIPHPQVLEACREVIRVSKRWVVAVEYFSAQRTMIEYQGERDRLWKDDFGKIYLDLGLKPVHQGFEWKPATGLDNLTWWVFEKR